VLQSTNDSTMFWRETQSDAEGRFEMHRLPEGGGNLFPIDHPNVGPWTYHAIDNLALRPGKTSEVTIELIEGVSVEGTAVEADTGKPIVGVSIGMYGPARPRSGAAIISAITDDHGRYQFRLPPGSTCFYIASARRSPSGAQSVVIPSGVKSFSIPTIEARPDAPPAPKAESLDTITVRGLVCDVSDEPISGALVIGAFIHAGRATNRRIVRASSHGRFALSMTAPENQTDSLCLSAFKEGHAPAVASSRLSDITAKPATDIKLILARTRPFVGIVQDHHSQPIAGADVRVESMRVPVLEGAGMTVTEVPWTLVRNTPIEDALRTTTDEKGSFRFPSAPARSTLNLVVTAKGVAIHRTSDFAKRAALGRRPSGFNDGFLHGTPDSPATIYLAPEVDPNGRRQDAEVREND
jgi:hypothetical protein